MGALPSRESNEGPNTVYFGNNTGIVAFRLPLTPHYFPSADCLAFKEVYRVRNSQSCKYSFNIREASAVLPDAFAKDFKASQEVDWGPEAEAVDPSLYYHDEEVQTRLVENVFNRTEKPHHHKSSSGSSCIENQHIRPPVECRQDLYKKLVVEPTTNALVDTDMEMREIYFAEKRWRAARDVVRRHRAFLKQQQMSELERSHLDSKEVVEVDVGEAELEAAEAVPPPPKWLRPIPEVVVERMSMEDACAAHRAYRSRHRNSDSGTTTTPPLKPSGDTPLNRRDSKGNLGCVPSSSDYYHRRDEVALSVLDEQGRRLLEESESLNEELLTSYPNFQGGNLPFEMDEQYMDGRVHMVAYDGVNYLFAYNPEYVRAMGKTVKVDGSLIEERRRSSGAVQSERCRRSFTTTHTVATRQADDFDDPNQRRTYEIFQPVYARYYIPVIPVRILGVDGFTPCNDEDHGEVRGAAWMRGVDNDEAEEYYEERTLLQKYGVAPPPVLRACRFIHAMIGDKILNRMSVLGCMTFRERCINAGLPDAFACPLWGVLTMNDIPQLQFQREIELRLLAAIHEIDDGDMRIRDALERQHQWNDYTNFTNSPMYGFIVSAPPERRFRAGADGKLREIGCADNEDDEESCGGGSSNEWEKCEEQQSRGYGNKKSAAAPRSRKANNGDKNSTQTSKRKEEEEEESTEAPVDPTRRPSNSNRAGVCPGLAFSLNGATNTNAATTIIATTRVAAASSNPSSDSESRDEGSGSTSARSAGHNASSTIVDNISGGSKHAELNASTTTRTIPMAGGASRVKRSRDGRTCIGGCVPPETVEHSAALTTVMLTAGMSQNCVEAAVQQKPDDDFECLTEPPPRELLCAWSFKRRRLGLTEDVIVNPNFSEEKWMPMVNPLTKDAALAAMGVRLSMRGRLALVRYSGAAVQKVLYYLSQASAPIFCLPYVGPPQQCPNVYFENVLRVPRALAVKSDAPQNGLMPPTTAQIETALAAYVQGKVSCYVFVDLNDHAANPPTSCMRNHRRDDALMSEAIEAGITSQLVFAQMPLKADVRCALEWYRKTLAAGPAPAPSSVDPFSSSASLYTSSPYASWPSLLDAPAPCDGDVLVVCPRTHRWIRITTLMLITSLLLVHKKIRDGADELVQPVPVLELFSDEHFAAEVDVCYESLVHKNTDSEGMQCHMLHMRNFFSYNGIVELVLDRLRAIVDSEGYEDKDNEGWLVLHEPPCTTGPSSLVSSPTITATTTTVTTASSTRSRTTLGPQNPGATAFTGHRFMQSGSYFIWSFPLAGQRYFFGTKPRFIRLALQRQKQNQRRRQKRKERDMLVGTASTSNKPANGENNNNDNDNMLVTPECADLSASVATAVTTTSTATGTTATPNGQKATQCESSLRSRNDIIHHNNSFRVPLTLFAGNVETTASLSGSASMSITAADSVRLTHDAVHYHQQSLQQQQQQQKQQQRSAQEVIPPPAPQPQQATTTQHVSYDLLHLTAQDRLIDEECNEMRELRQRHRLWKASRGICFVQESDSSHHLRCHTSSKNILDNDASSGGLELPRSLNLSAARWERPPLAGQPSCRRRLVVPIGPHGTGQPRVVDFEDVQRGVKGIADAFCGVTHYHHSSQSNESHHHSSNKKSVEACDVPLQKAGTPRVMDAERTSYRWDPYRVNE